MFATAFVVIIKLLQEEQLKLERCQQHLKQQDAEMFWLCLIDWIRQASFFIATKALRVSSCPHRHSAFLTSTCFSGFLGRCK